MWKTILSTLWGYGLIAKENYYQYNELLKDLDKGLTGNKAASQRARVNTVKLEKLAKIYRKESLPKRNKSLDEKKKSGQKR